MSATTAVNYEVIIGLEIHAQLNTQTKLFSSASNAFGNKPNSTVSPVCLGLPGALPVLNEAAVKKAILAGLALHCRINQTSIFSRKNYFYPDLPKGYQISQFDQPICGPGYLEISVSEQTKKIGITRIHMEEDAGKLVHQGAEGIAGATHSLVDLNRAGSPLIEIVSEPDIRSSKEAAIYMATIHELLVHIGVCNGNLEQGQLRCDANVSLRPVGTSTFGTRTEIKNLNSFRSVERAINSEIKRQTEVLSSGGIIVQETRNYDDMTQTTTSLRSKEDAHDYRYFPEPDLPPLVISDRVLAEVKATLPELPQVKRERYKTVLKLSKEVIKVLMGDIQIDHYFNKILHLNSAQKESVAAQDIAKWVVGDVNALLKENGQSFSQTLITPERLLELINMIQSGAISGKMAKSILPKLLTETTPLTAIIEADGGGQISDESALLDVISKILDNNSDVVLKIKNGKTQAAGFLMGQVMKETQGKAKPDLVRSLILAEVEKR